MAKAGFWLRGARGKFNDAVLRKGKSYTVQAEFKAPKNPQTALQMAQRIIFATVAGAAKFMKPIIDHSFEGISDKQASINHFKKINIARLRNFAADDYANQPAAADAKCYLTTRGISAIIPNSYQISDGSLEYNGEMYVKKSESGAPEWDFRTGEFTTSAGQFSVLDLITFLFGLSNSNQQFTYCQITRGNDAVYKYQEENETGTIINNDLFNYGRMVLSETAIQADEPYTFTTEQALREKIKSYMDTAKSSTVIVNKIIDNILFSLSGNTLDITPDEPAIEEAHAAAIIFSELKNGKWERSKSFMVLGHPSGGTNIISNFGLYYGIAIDAWFKKDQIAESDAFLSQGGSASGNFQ